MDFSKLPGLFYKAFNDIHAALNNMSDTPRDTTLKAHFREVQTSEHNSIFDRVFVETNELNWEKVLKSLKEKPITGNTGIYTSGLFSLDLASVERDHSHCDLNNIIIVDRAECVRKFWTPIEQIIKENECRHIAFGEIKDLLRQNKGSYFRECADQKAENCISSLEKKFNDQTGFLSTNEKYKKIRDIFCNDGFAFIQLDLCDQNNTKRFGELLATRSLKIDTLYVSNIYGLLFDDFESALTSRNGGDYESNFTNALLSKLGDLGRAKEAISVFKLTFEERKKLFATLYPDKNIYKQALLTISKKTQSNESKLDSDIKVCKHACDLFVTSMENILGKNFIDTHFIHASRKCDGGCCTNPMRMDESGSLQEILKTKTPCNKDESDRQYSNKDKRTNLSSVQTGIKIENGNLCETELNSAFMTCVDLRNVDLSGVNFSHVYNVNNSMEVDGQK